MKNKLILFSVSMAFAGVLLGANPVTMTKFYQYFSIDEIQVVESNGVLNGPVAMFLLDDNNPLEQKAALANAFVTNNQNNGTAHTFRQFLARQYRADFENLDLNLLNGEELFILGYLTIIDNKGNPDEGLPILEMADKKLTNSLTINMIMALAQAQQLINNGNSCQAWQTINGVTSGTGMNNDLDQAVVETIVSENNYLKTTCE